ncbi:MAG: hypothetical protein ACK53L_24960, partial [Pirellulaceae bacterium]
PALVCNQAGKPSLSTTMQRERVILDNSSQVAVPRRGTELHRASLLLLTSDMHGLFATFFGAS